MNVWTILCLIFTNWFLFSLWFLWAKTKDDYSVIDICWSLGFLSQAITVFIYRSYQNLELSLSHHFIFAVTFIWALRLAGYIAYRNKKKGEDSRYTEWRKDFQPRVSLNFYFRVYMLQAALNLLVGIGLVGVLSQNNLSTGWPLWLGLGLSLFGTLYETLADYQKDQFKKIKENAGIPCRKGLWYFSRHPNYFGEMVFWWGIFIFSLQSDAVTYAWLSPVLISFFLAKVSGVPLLTEQYKKKPAYKEYLETTNTFFPWPPKETK